MKRHRLIAFAAAIALMCFAPVPASAGRVDHSSTPIGAKTRAPALPTTGRLHPLAAPRRLVDSRTGLRLPAGLVAAHSTHRIVVSGTAGLPKSGLRAVVVVVTATVPTARTSIRLGSARSAPVLTAGPGTSSAFAIVPVASGAVALRNGAHPAHISIDVTGWFSRAHETSTAGLFKPLAGRALTSVIVKPGRTRTVRLRGLEDIPKVGVSTVLLRSTVSARRPGAVTVAPDVSSAKSTISLAHARGRSADLTLLRIARSGNTVIRNGGSHTVAVTVSSVGWFTDGRDAGAHGDALHLAPPSTVLAAAAIRPTGRAVGVCARAGIPAATSSRPASFVLARATARSPKVSNAVQVDAVGVTPAHVPALVTARAVTLSRLALLPPSAQCRTRIATSSGVSHVSLQSYGWFSGGTVLRDNLRILTSSTLAQVSTVTADSVTFTGAMPALATGDVVSAGISPNTPAGLLRTITGKSVSGDTTTLQTSPADLGDAVIEGSMSAGNTVSAPHVAAARSAGVAASARRDGPCSVDASFAALSADLSCSHTFGDGVFSAEVQASAGVTLTLGMDIAWGLVPKVNVHATLAFNAHASAQVSASAEKPLDKTLKLVKRHLSPIDVQLGPVPVVIEPEVEASLHLSGKLGATFSALAVANADASLTFDSKTGFRPQHSFSGNASTTVKKKIDADVKASFDPTMKADLYGLGSSYLSVGISPYVEAKADACTVRAFAGIDAHLGFSLGINHALRIAKDFTFPAVRKTLLAEPWRNCAVWSGTMTAKFLGHYLDDQGNKVGDAMSTATITLKPPPNGEPPEDGIYAFTGSGTGAQIAREFGCEDNPKALFDTYRKAWGDKMRKISGQGFSFSPGTSGTTAVQGVVDPSYEVRTTNTVSACPTGSSDSTAAVERSPVQFDIMWNTPNGPTTPAGKMSISGTETRHATPDGNGSTETRTFTWGLTKRCTLGGTHC